jgi:hypothetical protein
VGWRLSRPKGKTEAATATSNDPVPSKRSPLEILQIGEREGPKGETWGIGDQGWRRHGEANPFVATEGVPLYKFARYLTDRLQGQHFSETHVRWGLLAQWNTLDYVVVMMKGAAEAEADLKKRWLCEEIWSERRADLIVLVARYRGSSREAYEELIRTAKGKLALLGGE